MPNRRMSLSTLVALVCAVGALATFASTAAAAPTPTVTTTAATPIGTTTATLNGTVVLGSVPIVGISLPSMCYFNFGTSTDDVTNDTNSTTAVSESASGPFSAAVTGLTANTTYYFEAECSTLGDPGGPDATDGTVMTFKTAATGGGTTTTAPVVTTGAASAVMASTATLNGTVNPEGAATTCSFSYGTTTAYGQTVATMSVPAGTAPVAVTAAVSGLSASTAYHDVLVCNNGKGGMGTDSTFTTAAPSTSTTKAVATTGMATAVTTDSATLVGTVNPEGSAGGCYFQYGTTTSYGSLTQTVAYATGTTAIPVRVPTGTVLNAGTTYDYQLVCNNNGGSALGGNQQLVTTKSSYTVPTTLTGAATNLTATTATLNGTVAPQGVAGNCVFDYGTTSKYGLQTPVTFYPAGTAAVNVSSAISGLGPATTYDYQLVCTNAGGSSQGGNVAFSTTSQTGTAYPPVYSPPGTTKSTLSKVGITGPRSLYVNSKGYLVISVKCSTGTCAGALTVTTPTSSKIKAKKKSKKGALELADKAKKKKKKAKAKTYKVGSAKYKIAAGKTVKVKIKITKAYFNYLKKKFKLGVTFTALDSDKSKTTAKGTLKYHKPKKKHKKKK